MRAIIATFAIALVFGASATERLPISGVYGSSGACAWYAAGGEYAVLKEGMLEDGSMAVVDRPDMTESGPTVLVTPTKLISLELECIVSAVADDEVGFNCEADWGESPLRAMIVEDRNAGTLAVTADDATRVLHRCE